MCIFKAPKPQAMKVPEGSEVRNKEALEGQLLTDTKPVVEPDSVAPIVYGGGNKKPDEDPLIAGRRKGASALRIDLNTSDQTSGGVNV